MPTFGCVHSPTRHCARCSIASVDQLTATAPRALALPLIQRPRGLVLIELRRARRQHADEVATTRVNGGRVPGRRQELIRAVVARRAHDVVLASALARTRAREERIVV